MNILRSAPSTSTEQIAFALQQGNSYCGLAFDAEAGTAFLEAIHGRKRPQSESAISALFTLETLRGGKFPLPATSRAGAVAGLASA